MVSEKMRELGEKRSVIREIFEYSAKRKREIGADKVFDFSLGNPAVPPPDDVRDGLTALLQDMPPMKLHGYTSAAGDYEVRKAVADYLNQTHGTNIVPDLIYLTVGAAAALTASLHALCDPGDEVIVFAPYFPEYRVFIEKTGAAVKEVLLAEPGFTVDAEQLKNAVTEHTKAVILNSPNNPTGVVLDEENIREICSALRECERKFGHPIYLISDEPYRELVYGTVKVPFLPNYYADTLVCYSFSKSLSLPGERIGYVAVNPDAEDANGVFAAIMGAGRALGFVCAPALFQYLLPHCLGKTSDLSVYRTNRDLLYSALTEYGYTCVPPDGAFYLFVKALEPDAGAFCERAKQKELLLVPSDSFGCGGYVRIAYCTDTEMIRRSLPAFRALAEEYRNLKG